jgi:hypothetical protein
MDIAKILREEFFVCFQIVVHCEWKTFRIPKISLRESVAGIGSERIFTMTIDSLSLPVFNSVLLKLTSDKILQILFSGLPGIKS